MKQKEIDYSQLPESDVVVNNVYDRYKKGLYTLILITGLPGTGKSSCSIRQCELISNKIHGKNEIKSSDIVDSFLSFLKRLRQVKKPGECIDIEEVSVLFPSRRAMASDNVEIGRVLDTCRKKQVILIANAPIFPSIDSHIRAMAHILIQTEKINKTQEVVISRVWRIQTNPHSGKIYRHTLKRNGRDVNMIITKKPNSKVWEEYEDNKDKFLDELYKNLEHSAKKKKEKQEKEINKGKIIGIGRLTQKELNVHNLVNYQGMSQTDCAKELGVHPSAISKMLKNINKKSGMGNSKNGNELTKPIQATSS